MRLEANESVSQIAVIEGKVRFSSPVAELDVNEGQTARIENGSHPRFVLRREVAPFDSDRWSEQRDRALATSASAGHLPDLFFGLVDLDANGTWMQTDDVGTFWKPKVNSNWAPYRDGQWMWYDELGYTWVASEPWGWLPFHYGRWMQATSLGWVWQPGKGVIFKPGEVYWLREANVVGWGPLAPGETWDARAVPKLYARANTTVGKWKENTRELLPGDESEKLKTTEAVFVVAPPSPAMDAARLDAVRPVLRAGSTRVVPIVPGVTYEESSEPEMAAVPPVPPVPPEPAAAQIPDSAGPPPQVDAPPPLPVDIYYPAPIYTGIIVVNPPEDQPRRPRDPSSPSPSVKGPGTSTSSGPPEHPQPQRVHPIDPPDHHGDLPDTSHGPALQAGRTQPLRFGAS